MAKKPVPPRDAATAKLSAVYTQEKKAMIATAIVVIVPAMIVVGVWFCIRDRVDEAAGFARPRGRTRR